MNYTFAEKKRLRKSFAKRVSVQEVPYLLTTQIESFRHFIQEGVPTEAAPAAPAAVEAPAAPAKT